MVYPKIPLAQTIIQLCKSKGVRHIVISPGSRNAPLTIGFSNDSYFKCYSIVDERCAAFFSLGIAQQLQEPTAIVCTSGSALLNYYPAIAEAFYSNIPLVVLSADRPKYLIGIGDGQTINQKNVFENHILYSANLKLDLKNNNAVEKKEELPIFKSIENNLERMLSLKKDIQVFNEEEINKAINCSLEKNGPVHINIPFDEPLYETVETVSVLPKIISPEIKAQPIENFILKEDIEIWNSASKKMILVGVNYPNEVDDVWLNKLALDTSIMVFTETTSNLYHDKFFPSIDQVIDSLTTIQQEHLKPDILLTFGGFVISKKIKKFLRNYQPKHHWHIDERSVNDTYFCLNKHIKVSPNTFFKVFLPKTSQFKTSDYHSVWNTIKKSRIEKHHAYLKTIPFSDFKAFELLLKTIPDNCVLQVSNSSAIRYMQLFTINKTLQVFCNRGTSGIDGSVSTAIGCATVNDRQTVLITGDLSFLYDSNALWNNYIPNAFRIIIINNQGGGIFRILPGDKDSDNFSTYFETNHSLTAKHLCNMYDLEYLTASNEVELNSSLKSFYHTDNKPKVLEIFTPRAVNDKVLLNYFKYVG